jgi:hypothetical protein
MNDSMAMTICVVALFALIGFLAWIYRDKDE